MKPTLFLIKIFFLSVTLLASCENKKAATSISSGAGKWEKFPANKPGDSILYYTTNWFKGVITEVGVPYNAANKNAETKELKYLINDKTGWPEYMPYSQVVSPVKQTWWTEFFTGEWNVGEVMAVNTRTDGNDVIDEYSYGAASDILRVFPDNTYEWITTDKKTIKGKWIALNEGPGIVLQKAYRDMDWKFINETNAITMHIRHLENARLFPSGTEMSKSATRKMAE